MSLPPDLVWLPGQEGRRARCSLCHNPQSTGLKPSHVSEHLETRSHKEAVSVRNALLGADTYISDVEEEQDLEEPDGAYDHHVNEVDFAFEDFPLLPDDPPDPEAPPDPFRTDFANISDISSESYEDDPGLIDELDLDLNAISNLSDGDFHPFPSRLIFLLHAIASNPRSPMSIPQVQLILQLLRWLGVKNIPSYYAYKSGEEKARRATLGEAKRTEEVEGRERHHFVTTSISHELARDFSNPEIRPHISLYPRRDEKVQDMMDGEWVSSLRDDRAPPMAVFAPGQHAFVNEPVELADFRIILVLAWFQIKGKVHGQGILCEPSVNSSSLEVISDKEVTFPASSIINGGLQIAQNMGHHTVKWGQRTFPTRCSDREKARGRPVYTIFMKVFLDDLSGVRSKRWDVHHGLYFQNGNVDKELLGRDSSIKLYCASPSASAGEMMEAFLESLQDLNDGFDCWDGHTNEQIIVRPVLAVVVCDNPMAAELVSIVGMRGNFSCRSCLAGGTQAEKKTREGLKKLLTAGETRTSANIKQSLRKQLRLAASGRTTAIADEIRTTGVSDKWTAAACEELKEEHVLSQQSRDVMSDKVKDEYRNAVLDRPWAALLDFPHFDPSVQLPIEILHVVLLGLVKYLFRATINKLDERQKARLSARLSAADVDGLGLDSRLRGGYMVRHALSLNGKDFRALLAVVPSILPLVDTDDSLDSLSQAWLAAARLGSALYVDSIERTRLDAYQTYVNRCISSIFYTLAKAAPELLWSKPKLHLLCHTAVHFAAFGPLSSVSAERFEAFNSIVRSAAVHSNRLRPSRDIANTILRQQDIRHVLGAGRMADGGAVGTSLRILLRSPEGKVLLRMYGLDSMKTQRLPGSTTPLADSKIVWTQLPGDTATRRFQQVSSVVLWDTRDLVSPDSAILVATPIGKDNEQQWTSLLLVEDILMSASADPSKPVIIRASPLWPAHQDASEEDGLFEVVIGTEKQNVLLKDIVIHHLLYSPFYFSTDIHPLFYSKHPSIHLSADILFVLHFSTLHPPSILFSAHSVHIHLSKHPLFSSRTHMARPLTEISALLSDDIDHSHSDDDNDTTLRADQEPVEFSSPFAYSFVQSYPLPRQEQLVLCNMIRHYEGRSPLNQLLLHEDDDSDDPDHALTTKRAFRKEHGNIYYAPYDIIYGFGLAILAGTSQPQHSTLQGIARDLSAVKTHMNEASEGTSLSFDTKAVNALAAKIFYSGVVSDYSRGQGSANLEKAGMIYLRKRPVLLGPNGKKIMQPNNAVAQKTVRVAFHTKFTNLRNYVKGLLPKSMGKGSNAMNLRELADLLFKGYGIDVTNYRLYRLCLLRTLCAKQLIQTSQEDGVEQWDLPDDFWAALSSKTKTMMKESNKDDEHKAEIVNTFIKIMASDKKQYGDFRVLEDEAMVKAERELDACIIEAQGLSKDVDVDYLDRTQLSQASQLSPTDATVNGRPKPRPSNSSQPRSPPQPRSSSSSSSIAPARRQPRSSSSSSGIAPAQRQPRISSSSNFNKSRSSSNGQRPESREEDEEDGRSIPISRQERFGIGQFVLPTASTARITKTYGRSNRVKNGDQDARQQDIRTYGQSNKEGNDHQNAQKRSTPETGGSDDDVDEHARKKQKHAPTMLDDDDDDDKDEGAGSYDDDDKDNDDEDEIERSPLVATRTKKFKLNFGSPLPVRGESPEDFTD